MPSLLHCIYLCSVGTSLCFNSSLLPNFHFRQDLLIPPSLLLSLFFSFNICMHTHTFLDFMSWHLHISDPQKSCLQLLVWNCIVSSYICPVKSEVCNHYITSTALARPLPSSLSRDPYHNPRHYWQCSWNTPVLFLCITSIHCPWRVISAFMDSVVLHTLMIPLSKSLT